jgi:flagellar motor protein MotB
MPEDDISDITLQRSKSIQSYMQSIWGINPDKISISTGRLPRNPTNASTPDGQAENARAEITSKDVDLLQPIKKSIITRTMNPPILAIKPEIQAGNAVRTWDITIEDGNETVHTFKGEGPIPDSTFKWTIKPSSQMSNIPFLVTLSILDTHGINHSWDMNVQTERITLRNKKELRVNDTLIERFALILFDFDKSNLSPANQSIANTIKQSIKANSVVTITGYTDRTGDSTYNHALSEARCKQVSQFLGLSPGSFTINPMGGKEIPFENDTPQGRAYSRTVMIEVRTPIKERQ